MKHAHQPAQVISADVEEGEVLRYAFAQALQLAERDFRQAQTMLGCRGADESRARYARAQQLYQQLEDAFPFVLAGLGEGGV